MWKRLLLSALTVAMFAAVASAQEIDVDRYSIQASIDIPTNTLNAQATLDLVNATETSQSTLRLRISRKAKVAQVSLNGATAQYEVTPDYRFAGTNMIVITTPSGVAPGAKATATVNYSLDAADTTPILAIYPGEVILIPESVWFPAPSNAFAIYGPNSAPFTLNVTVNGAGSDFKIASAGAASSGGKTFSFDQKLNSLPFVVGGDFAAPVSADQGGVKVELYLQPGLTAGSGAHQETDAPGAGTKATSGTASEQAARVVDETGKIIAFMSRLLGPAPAGTTFRVISSVNAGNFSVPGALVLNEQVFRQDALDATTVELLADAIARIWIDGRVRVRGQDAHSADIDRPARKAESFALLWDSLPRYLAALYFQDRFGAVGGTEVFTRMRSAYQPVAAAHRDSEMAVETLASATYSDAAFSKGPVVLRLMSHIVGDDKFMDAVKRLFVGPQTKIVTTPDFQKSLPDSPELAKVFKDWVDSIIEPQLLIGIALATNTPGVQQVNLRNMGTGDIPTNVLAVSASGKQFNLPVTIPSQDLTSVEIPTDEKIVSVEVDPDKYYIQTNYDDDARPVKPTAATLLNKSIGDFNQAKYGDAETKLREATKNYPHNSLPFAWLARTLYAEKKLDEAKAQALAAMKIAPPLASALAWSDITMGLVDADQGHPDEAIPYLRRALVEAVEEPAQFAARQALIKSEKAAGKLPPVDPQVKSFISDLDSAAKQPSSDRLYQLIIKANLKKFVEGLVISPPQAWSTEILRADQIDANRVAVDIGLSVQDAGHVQQGTALYILYRANGKWMLESIKMFTVK